MGDEMKYNKLVRDKIPEIIRQNGDQPVTHVAKPQEYWKKLLEKLTEEVVEFKQAKEEKERKKEWVDIQELLFTIAEYKDWDVDELERLRSEKTKKNGAFEKRIILDEVI